MNANPKQSQNHNVWRNLLLTLVFASTSLAPAATVWTGPPITFTKAPGTDPTLPANQDRITSLVWLTRGAIQGLYNAKTETSFTHFSSPAGTAWANGAIADFASLSYSDWNTWAKTVNGGPPNTVNNNAVVHLISEDIYIAIKFLSWDAGGEGGFSYSRSTEGASLPTPTVDIIIPTNGASFTAPASVQIQADSDVSVGSVTNVAFFGNGALLGSDQLSPFSITTAGLAAGSYALTAVATAAGVSATSSVVNVIVLAPAPTVSITNPAAGAVFAAPASVQIQATAAVSSGTVTNVAFFGNDAPLGAVQTSPFSITTAALPAGDYTLAAVATAAGLSTTSAVVTIKVISPSPITATSARLSNGQFIFDYSADLGLSYVVQNSSNLVDWVSILTNVATSNPAHFAEGILPNGSRHYRVGRLPNP